MASVIKRKIGKASREDSRFARSQTYRYHFLKKKRGLFGLRLYPCAYCGKLVGLGHMQVDHLIPVGAAKRSRFIRNYVRFMGIFHGPQMRKQGINGVWNLVAACDKCNNRKSDNGGLWVIRGIIGRYLGPACWYAGILAVAASVVQFAVAGTGLIAMGVEAFGTVANWISKLSNLVV